MVFIKNEDRLFAKVGEEDIPVTVVWTKPVSGIGCEISVLSDGNEIMMTNIKDLDHESYRIVQEELEKNYFVPKVKRIFKAEVHLGNRYLHVDTDRGRRSLVIKNPFVDVRSVHGDQLLIRDVIGNRFLIDSVGTLDRFSRQELEKII